MHLNQTVTGGQQTGTAGKASWQQVYEALATADPDSLDADQLESLAEAAFWLGRPRESITARQRAYRAHREVNDVRRTTAAAWRLFYAHFDLDEMAAAGGWLQRAHRHALEMPDQVESQYVTLADADWALYNSKPDEALTFARQASAAGRAAQEPDLEALGIATQGRVLISQGNAADGLGRLDEAMVAALSGELTPFATGWIYCLLLYTCEELGDVRRAAEWTDLAIRWCEQEGQESWYPGLCRLHRCEVQSLRGDWSTAEREVLRVTTELAAFGDYLTAEGQYLVGEIRRRRGDVASAHEAFRRAHELGRDPQPGLALLHLDQGNAHQAAAALRLALTAGPTGPMRRARLLAAHVDAELSLGNVDAAAASSEELDELAEACRVPFLGAIAALSRGTVLLAREDAAALPALRRAGQTCRELSCPYEDAQARMLFGLAARQAGDENTARLELEAARASFERLGALPASQRATSLLAVSSAKPRGLTSREIEVLSLVAHGHSNRDIADNLYISEHTVARHVSNIFRKLDVTSRSAATSFAYEHQLA